MRRSLVTGNKRAPLTERGHDLYETPPEAVEALLDEDEWLGACEVRVIWEPACGPGSIVRALRKAGHRVIASDLIKYGCPHSSQSDFMLWNNVPPSVQAIVTNPPFKDAAAFAVKARELVPRVYMLLRLAFLESETRRSLLDSGDLAAVYVFRNRLPMMHRAGWSGNKASSAMAFAWFCWNREHSGPTELRRISWKRGE